jgi:dolichyl-phosphate beta-glucosyltransferase
MNIEINYFLSVIMPAFNEADIIVSSIETIFKFLNIQTYLSEIIVVNDGSTDRTKELIKKLMDRGTYTNDRVSLKFISYFPNKGKGYAVAKGIAASVSEYVLFIDADLSTPIEEVNSLLPYAINNYDIVIGSRIINPNIVKGRSFSRRLGSLFFNFLVRTLAVQGFLDTQCGFKLYRREVGCQLTRLQQIHGFAFDVEHLFLTKKLNYKVKEVPVRYEENENSSVKLFTDGIKMLIDIIKLKIYYHKK